LMFVESNRELHLERNSGHKLTWSLLGKPNEEEISIIEDAFRTWSSVCYIHFQRLQDYDNSANIRISFARPGGAWSLVGTDILLKEYKNKPTMNFGWDLRGQPETAAHEIGHSLGFPHEHQNPNAGLFWNAEQVYEEMNRTQGWDRPTIYHNILKKLTGVDGSQWDPSSIMHYPFSARLIQLPAPYNQTGISRPRGLSEKDREQARKFYPFNPPLSQSTVAGIQPQILSLQQGAVCHVAVTLRLNETKSVRLNTSGFPFNVAIILPGEKNAFISMFLKKQGVLKSAGSQIKPTRGKGANDWAVELKCEHLNEEIGEVSFFVVTY